MSLPLCKSIGPWIGLTLYLLGGCMHCLHGARAREYNMTGVLIATQDDRGIKKCAIPESCHGKMIQTGYINQFKYFDYLKRSRFQFLPQVHDASPRVSTQALTYDVPMLMNRNIKGDHAVDP